MVKDVIFALAVVLMIAWWISSARLDKKVKAIALSRWQELARTLGVRYIQPDNPSDLGYVEGVYRGLHGVVDRFSRSHGRYTREYTRVRTYFGRGMPPGLKLYADKSVIDALGKRLGAQDIEVGAPTFDRAFMIKGADEAEVRALLTPSARGALLRYPRADTLDIDEVCITDAFYWGIPGVREVQQVLEEQRAVVVALSGGA